MACVDFLDYRIQGRNAKCQCGDAEKRHDASTHSWNKSTRASVNAESADIRARLLGYFGCFF